MLNRDLLLTAAMFHDVGKLSELSTFPANDYTDDGQLLGHIMIGAMEVQKHIDQIAGFPKRTASELIHLYPWRIMGNWNMVHRKNRLWQKLSH